MTPSQNLNPLRVVTFGDSGFVFIYSLQVVSLLRRHHRVTLIPSFLYHVELGRRLSFSSSA